MQIAPSGYRRYVALRRNPEQRSQRVRRDEVLVPEIKCVWQANLQVYGADKVWQGWPDTLNIPLPPFENAQRKIRARRI